MKKVLSSFVVISFGVWGRSGKGDKGGRWKMETPWMHKKSWML